MITPERLFLNCVEWTEPCNVPPRLKRVMRWTFPVSFLLHIVVGVVAVATGMVASVVYTCIWFPCYFYGDD